MYLTRKINQPFHQFISSIIDEGKTQCTIYIEDNRGALDVKSLDINIVSINNQTYILSLGFQEEYNQYHDVYGGTIEYDFNKKQFDGILESKYDSIDITNIEYVISLFFNK